MNGFIKRALAGACLTGGLAGSGGCLPRYHDVVDPCYPERYNYAARSEVIAAFAPQVCNGHILDQTIWNWMFEPGTDKLHPAGMDKLDQLVRRRPLPDARLFLQTARDYAYAPADPEKFADARRELDGRRILAIQKYVSAQTAGRPMHFEVIVHDPAEVGQSAVSVGNTTRAYHAAAQGSLGSGLSAAGGAFGGTPSGNIIVNTAPVVPAGPPGTSPGSVPGGTATGPTAVGGGGPSSSGSR